VGVELKLPGWGLFARWVLASGAGFGIGAFVGMSLAWATVGVIPIAGGWTPTFLSPTYPIEWQVLNEAQRSSLLGAYFAPGGELILWTTAVIAGAAAQWLVVRKQARWARWWVLPVPLMVGVIGLTDPDVFNVAGGVLQIALHSKDFALTGMFYGSIAGALLIFFLRR
jgi:hypothetical protein